MRKETTIEERKMIINIWKGDKYGNKKVKDVAQIVKMPFKTVWNIINRYKCDGRVGNLGGRGRKPIFSNDEKKRIVRNTEKNSKLSGPILAKIALEQTGKKTSRFTIGRILKKEGLKSFRAKRKPFISAKNRKERLAFAKLHVDEDEEFWNRVLWSDESKYNVFGDDGRVRVWRKKNEGIKLKNINPTVKHNGGNIKIWGCFSSAGTGNFEFIDGIMDQYVYRDILKRNIKKSALQLGLGRRFVFQQDNDPKHTAKRITSFFKKTGVNVLKWPAQSPDLNPIEHLWDHLERVIRKHKISSKNELKDRLKEAWHEVQPDITKKLVSSMRNRCIAVIKANGGPTNY